VRWDVTPNGRITIGYSANYDLEVYDRTGIKVTTISHDYEPVKVTERDKKNYFDSVTFYRMGERLKNPPEYITKYIEFPKHKPVYKNILVDSEGNIWVVLNRERKDEKGKKFDTFNPKGEFISSVFIQGEAAFPDNHNAYIIHNGSFLLLKTGDDELFRLIRYRISG